MTRTKPLYLLLLVLLGGGVAWFLENALAASGRAVLIPPFTIGVALVAIAVIVIVMALPVRRVARRVPGARVDPFYATRVVTLAKATSLSGALLGGAGLAILGYLATRAVVPALASVSMALALTVGAIVLLVAGLVAEHMCALPPEDDERPTTAQTKDIP